VAASNAAHDLGMPQEARQMAHPAVALSPSNVTCLLTVSRGELLARDFKASEAAARAALAATPRRRLP